VTDERATSTHQLSQKTPIDLAGYAPTPPAPWWRRFFGPPHAWPERPEDPRQGWRTRIVILVDWRDRLRLLVSGRAEVLTTTYVEGTVTKTQSISSFAVLPPKGVE
jgi:hypothetical protein